MDLKKTGSFCAQKDIGDACAVELSSLQDTSSLRITELESAGIAVDWAIPQSDKHLKELLDKGHTAFNFGKVELPPKKLYLPSEELLELLSQKDR